MKPIYKVLIVDDDMLNLEILEEILMDFCDVKTANSGDEALDLLPKYMPDLILLDIMMPGMDGYEVCKKVRSDDRFCFVKIILVSGKAMLEERLEGYQAGADDYITKPFVDEELEAKVKVFLKLKRSEEVDRIKGDFLRIFSHETRTPLNGILLSTQLLLDDKTLSNDAMDYINVIDESGRRLLDFVKKTTFLCDLKGGLELKYTDEPVKMHVNNAIANLQKKAKQNNNSFKVKIPDNLEAKADWGILFQVISYILDNAVNYSPKNDDIFVTAKIEDGYCVISISDNGDGIKPEWINKIFNEFAIRDIMHHQKGLGLSLAISRHVMELHGGSIEVDSTPGKGAIFSLNLPV